MIAIAAAVAAGCGGGAPRIARHVQPHCLRTPGQQYVGAGGGELVHIPRRLPAHPAVLLAFHGLRQGAAGLASFTDLDDAADRGHFVVAYQSAYENGRWELNRHEGGHDLADTVDLIDALVKRLCVDPRRIYATGFSNGAGFAARVGCELADRIAAIAPVAGSYRSLDACPAGTRPMPTLEIHGKDPWLPTVPRLMRETARRNACRRAPVTTALTLAARRTAWPGCDLERVRLEHTGHEWPTRDAAVEDDRSRVSASELVWRFVSRYRR